MYGDFIIDIRLVIKQTPNAAKPMFNLAHIGWWQEPLEIAPSQHGHNFSALYIYVSIPTIWYINTYIVSNKLAHCVLMFFYKRCNG